MATLLDNVKRWPLSLVRFLVKFNKEERKILGDRGNVCVIRQIWVDLCLEYHICDYWKPSQRLKSYPLILQPYRSFTVSLNHREKLWMACNGPTDDWSQMFQTFSSIRRYISNASQTSLTRDGQCMNERGE